MDESKMEQSLSETNEHNQTLTPTEIPNDNINRTTATTPNIGFLPTSSSSDNIPPPKADFYAPPPYDETIKATKLPTYEEVQREKNLEEQNVPINTIPPTRVSQFRAPGQRILTIENETTEDVDTSLLGTDFMFYIAFFVAFIFNWIGFLLLMCFCHTIASRYGALSGFGLSLAKWTFIVQHSTDLASKDNSWLWWLIMTFGKKPVTAFSSFKRLENCPTELKNKLFILCFRSDHLHTCNSAVLKHKKRVAHALGKPPRKAFVFLLSFGVPTVINVIDKRA